jgi:hypothetical protein
MTRMRGVLTASALVLAGCVAAVLVSWGAPAPAKELGSSVQTLHIEALPNARTDARIAPAPAPADNSTTATRTIIGTTIVAPAPVAPATIEQPALAIGQTSCPANPHSGLPCLSH